MDQISKGGPVTVTDRNMTRFVMSIEESAKLVLSGLEQALGGEVLVTKMDVIKIIDLAEVMIEELSPQFGFDPRAVDIQIIGAKPGEKLYEELMSKEETRRSIELKDYYSILPPFLKKEHQKKYSVDSVVSDIVEDPYVSSEQKFLTKFELKKLLADYKLL